jgi:hypothetical protein
MKRKGMAAILGRCSGKIPYLHPLLLPQEIRGQLMYWKDLERSNSFAVKWFKAFTEPEETPHRVATLHLLGGITCHGHEDSGCKPFHIRANAYYRGNSRMHDLPGSTESVFSSLEIDYDESTYAEGDEQTTFVKVFAILDFGLQSRGKIRNEQWLIVCRYKKLQKQSHLPFSSYQFEMKSKKGGLGLDILPLSAIKRPTFMTPSADGASVETKDNFAAMIFHCIPFNRCVKTDNSLSTSHEVSGDDMAAVNTQLGVKSSDCMNVTTDFLFDPRRDVGGNDEDIISDFSESDSDQSDSNDYDWGS